LVSINSKETWITDQAFHILLKLAGRLKSDHAGWVHGNKLTDGNYHVAIKRLKKQISPNLKETSSEFIENNGRGSYRISTHPENISFNDTKIKALHRESWIQKLLESTG